jgi:hypothetical protein
LAKLLERLDKRHSADTFAKNLIMLLTAEAEYNIIFDETSSF